MRKFNREAEQVVAEGNGLSKPGQEPATGCNLSQREIEVKLQVDRQDLKRVLAFPALGAQGTPKEQELRSVYYDTPERDLQKNGITLRLRKRARATPLLGIKWTGNAAEGPFSRGEVEVPCVKGEPDMELFEPEIQERLSAVVGQLPLTLQFETRVKRRTLDVRQGHSQIEVAVDDGAIIAGGKQLPLTEVELELKAGTEADLYDFAMSLVRELPMRLDVTAKSEKGYRLADHGLAKPRKATPIAFPAAPSLDDAVSAVISNTLSHFVNNWSPLLETENPESVHQMRVALRRMRSALAMFKRVLPSPEIEDLRSGAKQIASALGEARECDVFQHNAEEGPLQGSSRPRGSDMLLAAIDARRKSAYEAVRKLIAEPATTLFALRVQSFLARRAWRNTLSGPQLPALVQPAEEFAKAALDRLYKRACKRGRHLAELSDEERHQLRIALKNLRYGAEFFGALFGHRRKLKQSLEHVSALQQILGAHNDAAMAKHFLETLAVPPDAAVEFASGYLLGWKEHGTTTSETKLGKTWKAFAGADPFWT